MSVVPYKRFTNNFWKENLLTRSLWVAEKQINALPEAYWAPNSVALSWYELPPNAANTQRIVDICSASQRRG